MLLPKRLLWRVDGVERVVMRTALGCPEANACGVLRDRDGGAWYALRGFCGGWCTQNADEWALTKDGARRSAL